MQSTAAAVAVPALQDVLSDEDIRNKAAVYRDIARSYRNQAYQVERSAERYAAAGNEVLAHGRRERARELHTRSQDYFAKSRALLGY